MNPEQGQAACRLKYPEIEAKVNQVRNELLANSKFTPAPARSAAPKN